MFRFDFDVHFASSEIRIVHHLVAMKGGSLPHTTKMLLRMRIGADVLVPSTGRMVKVICQSSTTVDKNLLVCD